MHPPVPWQHGLFMIELSVIQCADPPTIADAGDHELRLALPLLPNPQRLLPVRSIPMGKSEAFEQAERPSTSSE